ncbi:hypothetical protein [Merismopedia glauca]|uniref:Nucleotidyltransferase family protein n=1 Tax=Merismopedia glauca CCAP 1448/3 TaxID=1296344 RepID=A0A2T1BWP0_9CYAN|nr:hypothetical protein [Merismopedia glauca]PSB00368.1 hypothetical protein C7B64_23905 [Merismopedia glauca CCAP 1448/3]
MKIPHLVPPTGYRPQSSDTNLSADLLDFHLLQQLKPSARLALAVSLIQSSRRLSLQCLRRQESHLAEPLFAQHLARVWLQSDCPVNYIPTGSEMTWIQDSIGLATILSRIFQSLDVPYYVTGGVAAIAYGEPRTTRDLDVVLSIAPDQIDQLLQTLETAGFYVPEDLDRGGLLQVIHQETISRADLIVADNSEYEQVKFQRRRLVPWTDGTEIYLAAPEDIIISKLIWRSQSQSDKQWRDVLGIVKTQREALDFEYLYHWAFQFDLASVWQQATVEAGVRGIADERWVKALAEDAQTAFNVAKRRHRISSPAPGIEVAVGRLYVLTQDSRDGTLTITSRSDDREVAKLGLEGTLLTANPTLTDRQQWQEIRRAIQAQRDSDLELS